MEYRVEQLAGRAGVTVDTVRFYQARGLLPPPRRQGRVAWYGDEHLTRLERVRELQRKGLTLATIRQLLDGDLDPADQALLAAVTASSVPGDDDPEELLSLDELAARSGVPLPLLQAVVGEGILPPRVQDGEPRFTTTDVGVVSAALRLLEHGLPLTDLLDLARRHDAAVRQVAERAVTLFDDHIRTPLRQAGYDEDEVARRLVEAFEALLPAVTTVVAHHFRRTLLAVAQAHIEKDATPAEAEAVGT